jgi:hypothetical protein
MAMARTEGRFEFIVFGKGGTPHIIYCQTEEEILFNRKTCINSNWVGYVVVLDTMTLDGREDYFGEWHCDD